MASVDADGAGRVGRRGIQRSFQCIEGGGFSPALNACTLGVS